MTFKDVDVPKRVFDALRKLEDQYKVKLMTPLLQIADRMVVIQPGMGKESVFVNSISSIALGLEKLNDTKSFDYIFFIGIDGPKNWNAMPEADLKKRWDTKDSIERQKLKDEGFLLIRNVGGIDKIVSAVANGWSFNFKTKDLTFTPTKFWEVESDPVVFINQFFRQNKDGTEGNFRKGEILGATWTASLDAIVGENVNGVVTPRFAKIKYNGLSIDPTAKDNKLKEFIGLQFKGYGGFKAKVLGPVEGGYEFDGSNATWLPAELPIDFQEIKNAIEKIPCIKILTTEGLADWTTENAKKYGQYFYMELSLSTVQEFKSGQVQLNCRDLYSAPEFDIPSSLPDGTSMKDFSLLPGSRIHVFGRSYFKKKRYNKTTKESELFQWPAIKVMGAKSFANMEQLDVANILSAIGLGAAPVVLTEEGDQ